MILFLNARLKNSMPLQLKKIFLKIFQKSIDKMKEVWYNIITERDREPEKREVNKMFALVYGIIGLAFVIGCFAYVIVSEFFS